MRRGAEFYKGLVHVGMMATLLLGCTKNLAKQQDEVDCQKIAATTEIVNLYGWLFSLFTDKNIYPDTALLYGEACEEQKQNQGEASQICEAVEEHIKEKGYPSQEIVPGVKVDVPPLRSRSACNDANATTYMTDTELEELQDLIEDELHTTIKDLMNDTQE